MKITTRTRGGEDGSVLMIALMIALILGIGLASYLLLVRAQNVSTYRSQGWNGAMAMAEAGIEEALAQLNPSALLFTTNINRGANGWVAGSGGFYSPRRQLDDGYYDVLITADSLPYIYSTGYVKVPTFSVPIQRAVRVKTTYGRLFQYAMAAKIEIDFKGAGVETDSFDSNDETYSTGGLYDPAKRKANGDVATTAGILNVGNAKVMGTLFTGPEGGYSLGPNGSVGDVGYVLGGNRGIQEGHYRNDFNMDFPDVLPPYASGLMPQGKEINGTNYFWVLGSGNYMDGASGGVKLQTGDKILVTGRSRVFVTGDFLMSGEAAIMIAPGASLELYVAGANASITKLNNAGSCAAFRYYGLPSNTTLTLSGNSAFLGSIYAPNAFFTLGGGGSDWVDFQGACVVNRIRMNGHYKFHFDENLRRKGPVRGFQVVEWKEI
jgi:hypothetical protein